MKKLILLALVFITIQVTAQKENKNHHGKKIYEQFDAKDIAQIKTKKLTLRLDLDKSQQQKVEAIFFEEAKNRKSKIAERKAKKNSGEIKTPTKEERLDRINKMLDHKIELKAKMKNVLSKEQYEKWTTNMSKKHRCKGKKKSCKNKK